MKLIDYQFFDTFCLFYFDNKRVATFDIVGKNKNNNKIIIDEKGYYLDDFDEEIWVSNNFDNKSDIEVYANPNYGW
jgi:hypothetical protein